jgi:hypothetical protein
MGNRLRCLFWVSGVGERNWGGRGIYHSETSYCEFVVFVAIVFVAM